MTAALFAARAALTRASVALAVVVAAMTTLGVYDLATALGGAQ